MCFILIYFLLYMQFRPEQKFDQVVDYVVLGTETAIENALKEHPVIAHAVLTDNLQNYESVSVFILFNFIFTLFSYFCKLFFRLVGSTLSKPFW